VKPQRQTKPITIDDEVPPFIFRWSSCFMQISELPSIIQFHDFIKKCRTGYPVKVCSLNFSRSVNGPICYSLRRIFTSFDGENDILGQKNWRYLSV
jgi:hypothetical protein